MGKSCWRARLMPQAPAGMNSCIFSLLAPTRHHRGHMYSHVMGSYMKENLLDHHFTVFSPTSARISSIFNKISKQVNNLFSIRICSL